MMVVRLFLLLRRRHPFKEYVIAINTVAASRLLESFVIDDPDNE